MLEISQEKRAHSCGIKKFDDTVSVLKAYAVTRINHNL